ncbi:hypothetical protein FRC07_011448 [Ceratobasidium sp. 392]|nr:hypothetical protein FRC07_011448 [Ceratobasidium sp. 392]
MVHAGAKPTCLGKLGAHWAPDSIGLGQSSVIEALTDREGPKASHRWQSGVRVARRGFRVGSVSSRGSLGLSVSETLTGKHGSPEVTSTLWYWRGAVTGCSPFLYRWSMSEGRRGQVWRSDSSCRWAKAALIFKAIIKVRGLREARAVSAGSVHAETVVDKYTVHRERVESLRPKTWRTPALERGVEENGTRNVVRAIQSASVVST